MALSGEFTTSSWSGWVTLDGENTWIYPTWLKITWKIENQSHEDNTSNIKWEMWGCRETPSDGKWTTCKYFKLLVNGTAVDAPNAFENNIIYNYQDQETEQLPTEFDVRNTDKIASGMFKISHNTDGTLSLNMQASMTVTTGDLEPNSTGDAVFEVDRIVRKSRLHVDRMRLGLTDTLTCTMTAYHPDVEHVVDYKLNGNSYLIDQWVSASRVVEWVPGDYFGEKIPGSSGAYCEVRCHTYYNYECIGTDSVTVYVSIPQDCEPDLSLSVSMVDASGGLLRGGEWVKNNCKAKLTFVNRPKYGAQPAYSNLVGPGIDIRGLHEAEGTYTTDIITQSGTATWSYSANDTRNTWNECSVSVNVLDSMIIAVICDGAGKVTRYIPMIHNGTDYVEYALDITSSFSAVEETVYTVDAN